METSPFNELINDYGGSSNASSSRKNNEKKTRRAKLSCLECRRKKLSCDRNLPCQRCIRSRRAEHCVFEDGPQALSSKSNDPRQQSSEVNEHLLKLQSDVEQLRSALAEAQTQITSINHNVQASSTPLITHLPSTRPTKGQQQLSTSANAVAIQSETVHDEAVNDRIKSGDPFFRSPRIFYSRHFLFRFFNEMPGMWSLIKETMDEWIRPLGIHLKKDKTTPGADAADTSQQDKVAVENLLPPKADTDELVAFYINYLEHVYRVVHIGTFRQEYANYWEEGGPKTLPMSMLLVAICSLSTSTYAEPCHPTSLTMRYRHMHKTWLSWCDAWLAQAGRKRRVLIHHQVACLVYLSKRANAIEKKSWWKLTASLVQDAMMDGLHCEPSRSENALLQETKRRLWGTIRELDLQNSFELGMPSLLFSIDSDIAVPANISDAEVDEDPEQTTPSQPFDTYTSTSFLCHSSRSWNLRLEIAQRLSSTQSSTPLNYNDVLQYTSLIMQAITDLPSWENENASEKDDNKLLVATFLLGTLQQALLALHQPFLQGDGGQSNLSQTISCDTARGMLLSKQRLQESLFPIANLLRADVFLAALTLSHITLLRLEFSNAHQPDRFSDSIALLEECLPLMEENLPRRAMGGHWDLNTLHASVMLVKIRLGLESRETAKALMAKLFLGAYYKYFGEQSSSGTDYLHATRSTGSTDNQKHAQDSQTSQDGLNVKGWSWLSEEFAEMDFDAFDSAINADGSWNDWSGM